MRLTVSLGFIAAMSCPALAGWQWTEWGMTKEQVLSGAPGELSEKVSDGDRWVLATTHDAVGFTFDAELWGYTTVDGLMAVKLASSKPGACEAVTAGLREAHGQDAETGQSPSGSYWSLPDDTKIQVTRDADGRCQVNYVGLAAPRTDGL